MWTNNLFFVAFFFFFLYHWNKEIPAWVWTQKGLQKYSAAILHWVGHGVVQQVEHLEAYIPRICCMNGAYPTWIY